MTQVVVQPQLPPHQVRIFPLIVCAATLATAISTSAPIYGEVAALQVGASTSREVPRAAPSRSASDARAVELLKSLMEAEARSAAEIGHLRAEVERLRTSVGGLEEAVRNAGTFRLFDWSHLASFVAGVAASFLATVLWDWRTRPRVVLLGLERAETTFGVLRKIRFRLRGHASPGVCGMRLEWPRGDLFAKWDETPNPLEGDHLDRFRAELVPAAFYQPLFHHRDYVVPIIVERNGGHEVFSGWWVGRAAGYGPDPAIRDDEHIRVTITGAGLHWSRSLSVARLVGLG